MTTAISSTITVSAPVVSAPVTVKDKLVQLGELVISGAKTTTALLEQIAACTNAPLSEQSIIDWAIAGGAWKEQYTRPRSLWQEVSRGKRSGGKASCRWSLIGSLDNTGCLVLFEYKDKDKDDNLEDRLPIEQVAGLGRLCAAAANRQSAEKAREKAKESEVRRHEAERSAQLERYQKEIDKLKWADGQDKLFAQLTQDAQKAHLAFWAKGIVFEVPSASAILLASRAEQYKIALDASRSHELQEKYTLWRNKRQEQIALAKMKEQERKEKEQERKEKEQVKNAILLQNYASIIKSIQIACNKLPVELQPGKNKAAKDMAAVLEEIRFLLRQDKQEEQGQGQEQDKE